MNQGDFGAFSELLSSEVEIRNGKPLSQAAIGLWWERVKRFELEQVKRAFALYACEENGRFMPQPSDLIRHIEGTSTDRGAIAWGVVMGAMSDVGAYRDVDFRDPAAHAAIRDLGGWPKLCRTEVKELGFLRKRFTDSYLAYQTHLAPDDAPKALTGDRSTDTEYEKKGMKPPAPIVVTGMPTRTAPTMPALGRAARKALGFA